MKKPLNKFALGIGVIGVIYLLAKLATLFAVDHTAANLAAAMTANPDAKPLAMSLSAFLTQMRSAETFLSALFGATQLIGLAIIVELVDQIRWNAIHRQS